MRNILILLSLLTFNYHSAQLAMGNWRMHIANKAIDIEAGGNKIFAAYETGLLEYDLGSKETRTWTNADLLSDVFVSCIFYHAQTNSFYIGYKNGNIDKITGSSLTNIPSLKIASVQGDKTVYSFYADSKYIYASTGIGILVLNPQNDEIKDTYFPNSTSEPIIDITILGDSIYAISPKNVWTCNTTNTGISDPNQWKMNSLIPMITNPDQYYKNIFNINSNIYLSVLNKNYALDSLFLLTNQGLQSQLNFSFAAEIRNFKYRNEKLLITLEDAVLVYNNNIEGIEAYTNFGAFTNIKFNNATMNGSLVYIADEYNGIFEINGYDLKNIKSAGPYKNSFYSLSGYKDMIGVAGGLYKANTLNFNTSGAYVFKSEDWLKFDNESRTDTMSKLLFDVSAVSINPRNTDEIAFSSFSEIPLLISNNSTNFTEYYDDKNSILEGYTPVNEISCISDLEYDDQGNLWIVNCLSSDLLKVKTKDNEWYKFSFSSDVQGKYTGKLIVDYQGYKWFTVLGKGLVGFDDNGTISDKSDDRYVVLNEGSNTGNLPDPTVNCVAVDLDDEIWIGTPSGFAILYNSSSAFGASPGDYNAQRIKIEYEGNVEYVLGNTDISDIEVDGGNRKWIGTANAGIFLLSPDGSEVILNYTKDNSDLISNTIIDMQFNTKTGELFIITDLGLVSLRTDASTGDDKYKDVIVFPNPVKPDFNGFITIQGIKYDSDVKFTDIAGNVVYQTTSNGGTAIWNGKNYAGEKVKSGTYLIWTASNTEKGRKVGKVVIIN